MNYIAITEEYRRQRETLLSEFPELQGDPRTLSDTMDGLTSASDVIAQCIRSALDADALAEALAARIKDMGERKARLVARGEKLRAIALALMNAVDMPRMEVPEFTAFVRPSQPKVIVTDETLLPDQYFRVKREPDKMALREALTTGSEIPGAVLNNSPPGLTVRTK